MRQIGRLGSGIVEIGAVKRLIVWYGVYNQSKTEKMMELAIKNGY